jgi:hypothetical protein
VPIVLLAELAWLKVVCGWGKEIWVSARRKSGGLIGWSHAPMMYRPQELSLWRRPQECCGEEGCDSFERAAAEELVGCFLGNGK